MGFSCGADSNCVSVNMVGDQLVAELIVSTAEGNALVCTEDGAYVPGGALAEATLPAGPADGQIAYFVASNLEGIIWALRYRADSPSIYKWEWVGGTELRNKEDGFDTMGGAGADGYRNISGGAIGPDVTLPLAGDYLVQLEALIDGATDGSQTSASVKRGGTAAEFDDAIANYTDRYISVSRTIRMNGVAAGTLLRLQYHKTTDDDASFGHRVLAARPVRVKAA